MCGEDEEFFLIAKNVFNRKAHQTLTQQDSKHDHVCQPLQCEDSAIRYHHIAVPVATQSDMHA